MTYLIQTTEGLREVEGEIIKIGQWPCGLMQEPIEDKWGNYDEWVVTELQTGMRVCVDLDRDACVKKAGLLLNRYDFPKIMLRQKDLLIERGHKWPVND